MHLKNGIIIQHHCYGEQGLLLRRTGVLLRRTGLLLRRTRVIVTENKGYCYGEQGYYRGQGFIFVYRLVLDAKPVRVDDVAG